MNKFLAIIFLSTTITHSAISESDLNSQNNQKEHLNPLNDNESADNSSNVQDKRTIFSPVSNVGWAKHVGIGRGGGKYVIGYSPVDLKLSPVIRPIAIRHTGYRYGKPNIHFHIKSPAVIKPRPIGGGWRPVVTIPKPVVQVVKPSHVDVVHQQPVPHVDHVDTHADHHHHVYGVPAAPVDHVHQVQHVDNIHVDHVHQVPHVHPVPSHIDQVHQVQVAHGDHIDTATHVDHLHPVHVHPTQAAIPVVPSLRPIFQQQFLPSPVLFEVTKPNLGVLPLGATFPHPVLPEIRHVHYRPTVVPQPLIPVAQPLPPPVPVAPLPQPVIPQVPPPHLHPVALPVPQPVPHPAVHIPHQFVPAPYPHYPAQPPFIHHAPTPEVIHRPAVAQPQYPPGTVIEYHGTHNFVPINGLQPLIPQTPANAVQALMHHHLNFNSLEDVQGGPHLHFNSLAGVRGQPVLHQDEQPHLHFNSLAGVRGQPVLHQDEQPHLHFNGLTGVHGEPVQHHELQPQYQQLPADSPTPNFLQQPLPSGAEANFQNQQYFPQEITNIQHYDGATSSAVIQPGQSDLQLPYHLPQHNFVPDGRSFQPGNFHDPSQYPDGAISRNFRPSIQLEPPFKKK